MSTCKDKLQEARARVGREAEQEARGRFAVLLQRYMDGDAEEEAAEGEWAAQREEGVRKCQFLRK